MVGCQIEQFWYVSLTLSQVFNPLRAPRLCNITGGDRVSVPVHGVLWGGKLIGLMVHRDYQPGHAPCGLFRIGIVRIILISRFLWSVRVC